MNSLITIHHKRKRNLENTLKAISRGSQLPDEVIVVNIGPEPSLTEDFGFDLKWVQIDDYDPQFLPIPKARNLGAAKAEGDHLIFLDVDCVPSADFVKTISNYLENHKGLIMGHPKYLYHSIKGDEVDKELKAISRDHHKRPSVDGIEECSDPGLFWSLCFGISKRLFEKLEGFDEGFKGYGGEDTDLSFRCKQNDVPFYLCDAVTFHQHHGFYSPPLNNMESIVANSNYFRKKWGAWCMQKHMKAFKMMGFVDWDEKASREASIIKEVEPFQMEQYYVHDAPYA